MKTAFVLALALSFSSVVFARSPMPTTVPAAVAKAADEMRMNDVRNVVRPVENVDGNPCMPEGWSFQVDLQVKKAIWNGEKMAVEYEWETVKTIGVDNDGGVMEVCAE